jgi:hypothetical protein
MLFEVPTNIENVTILSNKILPGNEINETPKKSEYNFD